MDYWGGGKLNHHEFAKTIDYGRFLHQAVETLERLGAVYYIKSDLATMDPALMAKRNWGNLLLPLHDAFLVEIPEDVVDEAVPEIRRLLEHSPLFAIPLRTTVGIGHSWADAEASAK